MLKVMYLGHSGFLVETDKNYFLFDYVAEAQYKDGEIDLTAKQFEVDFDAMAGKPIFMLNSHNHFDHYNSKLHATLAANKNIRFVVGGVEMTLPRSTNLLPRQSVILDGVTVHSAKSNDLGVCFLVEEKNGAVIYHSGDHTMWASRAVDSAYFKREIEYLNTLGIKVDVAFVVACDAWGNPRPSITEAAHFIAEAFSPRCIIPMHSIYPTKAYEELAADLTSAGYKAVALNTLGEVLSID